MSMKIGILPSPQYTTWEELRRVAVEADCLGYASLWCSDHLYAPYPWVTGPAFEAYTVLAGWAAVTERIRLGAMVSAVSFRNPALLVKTATTLDHVSNGRAVLSIGAGWFETEHEAFGFDFGPPGERVDRLEEALSIVRDMLDGKPASGSRFYRTASVQNLPAPVQDRLPVLIGGRGNRMLGLVARYADAWNVNGFLADITERDEALRRQCEAVGRDHAEIERTYHGGPMFVRDDVEEAQALCDRTFEHHGIEGIALDLIGPPERIVERLLPIAQLGFHHMYFDLISPYDDETLHRLATEVKPMLDEALASGRAPVFTAAPVPTEETPMNETAVDNLVKNPGFEEPLDDGADAPPGWNLTLSDSGADAWALDADVAHGDGQSLRAEPRGHVVLWQSLDAPLDELEGKTVRFSLDVRQEGVTGPTVLQVLAMNPDLPEDPVLRTGVAGWRQVVVPMAREGQFRTYNGKFVAKGPATSLQFTISATGNGGKVWFDNAVVSIED